MLWPAKYRSAHKRLCNRLTDLLIYTDHFYRFALPSRLMEMTKAPL